MCFDIDPFSPKYHHDLIYITSLISIYLTLTLNTHLYRGCNYEE